MSGPLLNMLEVADLLNIQGDKRDYRRQKAFRLLTHLEKQYGTTLLIRAGGTVKPGRWYCPQKALMAIVEPQEDQIDLLIIKRTLEDLRLRVEDLECRLATTCKS